MTWIAGLFDAKSDVSSTRVLAFILGIGGLALAFIHPDAWQTITSLVGGGAVSLALRKSGPAPSSSNPDA